MGLLSGKTIPAIFGKAFRPIYEDGVLQKIEKVRLRNGTFSTAVARSVPVKVQLDRVSERMSQVEGAAVTDKTVYILRDGLDEEVTSDDLLVARGKTWSLNDVNTDPARSYFEARAVLQRQGVTP